jgi:hypothetical protein
MGRDLLGRMTLEEKIAQLTPKGADKFQMTGEVADRDIAVSPPLRL